MELPSNVKFLHGDSIAPAMVAQVRELCAGRRTMVMANGNHEADHVLEELRLYARFVEEGCYLIAEDGIGDVMDWKEYTPGPAIAAHRFAAENDEFDISRSREKFLLTYAPDGFVKRIKPKRRQGRRAAPSGARATQGC